jgi:hypothetical protein
MVTINTSAAKQVLAKLDPPASGDLASAKVEDCWNAALGCKTSEVALTLVPRHNRVRANIN